MVTSKRPLSLSCWRRVYLAERGAKPLPLADMSTLVTGVVALRLAADSVLSACGSAPTSGTPRRTGWWRGLSS
ncbi:hypothetical protein SAMN05446589_9420 [Streptomyces sp. OV198]|nr:hypothetical protein SAMN05446589_9420 [Streptomyces sp. OV198]